MFLAKSGEPGPSLLQKAFHQVTLDERIRHRPESWVDRRAGCPSISNNGGTKPQLLNVRTAGSRTGTGYRLPSGSFGSEQHHYGVVPKL